MSDSTIEIGMDLLKLFDAEEFPRLVTAINDACEHSRSSLISEKLNKLPFELKVGETLLSYNLNISPLTNASKPAKGVLLQFLDITKVKKRENYLKRKQKELEQQRERSFSQERLASLGELTSSIAHEINNPLSVLELNNKALGKVLKRENIESEMLEELIEDNQKTIKRISDLIAGVRNLSRKPSDDDFEMGTLGLVLSDLKPVFSQLFKANSVEFKVDLDSEVLNIEIPLLRVLVTQVFVNLLNNAIFEVKTREGSQWIEVDGSFDDEFLYINFTDSGDGIPEEIRDKIFLPFYTTKEFGKGTGLGLSTIYKIMQNHGGDIKVDPDCENTRFLLRFSRTRSGSEELLDVGT